MESNRCEMACQDYSMAIFCFLFRWILDQYKQTVQLIFGILVSRITDRKLEFPQNVILK